MSLKIPENTIHYPFGIVSQEGSERIPLLNDFCHQVGFNQATSSPGKLNLAEASRNHRRPLRGKLNRIDERASFLSKLFQGRHSLDTFLDE